MSNRTLLLKRFEKADKNKTGTNLLVRFNYDYFLIKIDHLPLTTWADIMTDVLQVDLPWLILRAKLVQEDGKGILYKTMFNDYILDNSKFQMVRKIDFAF